MNRIASLVTAVVLSGATMLLAIPAVAQVRETSASGQAVSAKDDATPALTLAEVESALVSIEADAGVEDSVKSLLRRKYEQAIEALQVCEMQAVGVTWRMKQPAVSYFGRIHLCAQAAGTIEVR